MKKSNSYLLLFLYSQAVEIPGVKSKVKTDQWSGYMSGSSDAAKKALAIKNRVVSLHDHAQPLEEELGLAMFLRRNSQL